MRLITKIHEVARRGFGKCQQDDLAERFYVCVVDPLDFHVEATVEFGDFLKRQCWRIGSDESDCGPLYGVLAASIASMLPCWDARDDSMMRVGHDLSTDSPVFIFKQNNNGTTILVSMNPLSLPGRCIFEQYKFDLGLSFRIVGDNATPA